MADCHICGAVEHRHAHILQRLMQIAFPLGLTTDGGGFADQTYDDVPEPAYQPATEPVASPVLVQTAATEVPPALNAVRAPFSQPMRANVQPQARVGEPPISAPPVAVSVPVGPRLGPANR